MASNPLTDLLNDRTKRQTRTVAKTNGRFTVATTSPFTVYLDGSTTAVAAKKVAGLTYSVGTTGMYLLRQGQQPVCIPLV